MSWIDKLKGLLGQEPPTRQRGALPAKKPPAAKSAAARAVLIKRAMALREQGRAQAEAVLDQAMRDLKANPPKPSDREGIMRLLAVRRAALRLKGQGDAD
jgi:hypothetical protein